MAQFRHVLPSSNASAAIRENREQVLQGDEDRNPGRLQKGIAENMKYQVYAQRAATLPYPIGWPDKSTLSFISENKDAAIKRCDEVYEGYVQVSSIPGFALAAIQFTVRDEDGNILHRAGNI